MLKLTNNKLNENGKVVFKPEYHIKRGWCCGSNCRHCPFLPKHIKGNITLSDIYMKLV